MMFTFVFLVLTYEPSFAKTSRALKGIVLMHVLYMCYVFCLQSGASLNPALGFAQTIYWVGIAATDKVNFDASLIWVYSLMPFIGALVAAKLYDIFAPISSAFSKAVPEDESEISARNDSTSSKLLFKFNGPEGRGEEIKEQ